MGNPISYRGMTMEWEQGRKLKKITGNGVTQSHSYDADGIRIRKVVTNWITHCIIADLLTSVLSKLIFPCTVSVSISFCSFCCTSHCISFCISIGLTGCNIASGIICIHNRLILPSVILSNQLIQLIIEISYFADFTAFVSFVHVSWYPT